MPQFQAEKFKLGHYPRPPQTRSRLVPRSDAAVLPTMLMAGACFMPEKSACYAGSVLLIGNWNAASERDSRNRFGGHLNDCSRP